MSQLNRQPIERIVIECQGTIEDTRPISLAAIKGLLAPTLPDRINYVNAETIAKELGLDVEVRYVNSESSYNNVISLLVVTAKKTYQLDGSIFNDSKPRLVNVLGRDTSIESPANPSTKSYTLGPSTSTHTKP